MDISLIIDQELVWGYSLKTVLIATVVFATIIALLKKYFNGGSFSIPNISLKGKTAVVTGGNSGIGAETVRELAKLGCSIVIGARDKSTATTLIKSIKKENPSAEVEFVSLDLSSF